MGILRNIKESYLHIPYTIKHKVVVSRIGWKVYKRKYLFHDMDKLLMYLFLPFLGTEKISKIHRNYIGHHLNNGLSDKKIQEAFVDWESARFTKKDKPLNARDTLDEYFYTISSPHVLKMLDDFESGL